MSLGFGEILVILFIVLLIVVPSVVLFYILRGLVRWLTRADSAVDLKSVEKE